MLRNARKFKMWLRTKQLLIRHWAGCKLDVPFFNASNFPKSLKRLEFVLEVLAQFSIA
jgi:hypothetical protein